MGWCCKHALIVLVLVVMGVVVWQLPVPAVVLPDPGLCVAAGNVLWWLAGSFLVWLVVLPYLRRVVQISDGGFDSIIVEILVAKGLLVVHIRWHEVGI